jgi:hypothetical protein
MAITNVHVLSLEGALCRENNCDFPDTLARFAHLPIRDIVIHPLGQCMTITRQFLQEGWRTCDAQADLHVVHVGAWYYRGQQRGRRYNTNHYEGLHRSIAARIVNSLVDDHVFWMLQGHDLIVFGRVRTPGRRE